MYTYFKLILILFVCIPIHALAIEFIAPGSGVVATINLNQNNQSLSIQATHGLNILSPTTLSGPLAFASNATVNATVSTASYVVSYSGNPMVASSTLKVPISTTSQSACTQAGLLVFSTASGKLELCNGTQFKPY